MMANANQYPTANSGPFPPPALPPVRVEAIVRLNRHLDALERIADKFPYSDDGRFDAVQRTIMDILVSEGRYEVAPNGFWRKPNNHSTDSQSV